MAPHRCPVSFLEPLQLGGLPLTQAPSEPFCNHAAALKNVLRAEGRWGVLEADCDAMSEPGPTR